MQARHQSPLLSRLSSNQQHHVLREPQLIVGYRHLAVAEYHLAMFDNEHGSISQQLAIVDWVNTSTPLYQSNNIEFYSLVSLLTLNVQHQVKEL